MNAERRPARGGVLNGVGEDSTAEITPTTAARHALRRRLERIARDEDARGDREAAAVAKWLLEGVA